MRVYQHNFVSNSLFLILIIFGNLAYATVNPAINCASLVGSIPAPPGAHSAQITSAVLETADPIQDVDPILHCLVAGEIDADPNQSSIIKFRMRLPQNWNERLFMAGDGNDAGNEANEFFLTVNFNSNISVLRRGFATVTTDTGHVSSIGWALDEPPSPGIDSEAEINFGYLAVHLTAVAAKSVLNIYYGQMPAYSYFNGCSNGGRQGMIEAVRYPDDFDGIISVAPSIDIVGYGVRNAVYNKAQLKITNNLSESKLNLVNNVVLDMCDAKDGVVDGMLLDPRECQFKPKKHLPRCPQNVNAPDCFTDEQINLLTLLYSKIITKDPSAIIHGLSVGSEAKGNMILQGYITTGWISWVIDDPILEEFFGIKNYGIYGIDDLYKYYILDDETFDIEQYLTEGDISTFSKDMAIIKDGIDLPNLNFKPFGNRGGKLLMMQGWLDPAETPEANMHMFKQIQRKNDGRKAFDDYARLFMVPGLGHCGGGPGAYHFDFVEVMQKWVEDGIAPESITATSPDQSITRKLCKYPKKAIIINPQGNTNDISNYICK